MTVGHGFLLRDFRFWDPPPAFFSIDDMIIVFLQPCGIDRALSFYMVFRFTAHVEQKAG